MIQSRTGLKFAGALAPRACWRTSLLFLVIPPYPPAGSLAQASPSLVEVQSHSGPLGTNFFQLFPRSFFDLISGSVFGPKKLSKLVNNWPRNWNFRFSEVTRFLSVLWEGQFCENQCFVCTKRSFLKIQGFEKPPPKASQKHQKTSKLCVKTCCCFKSKKNKIFVQFWNQK